MLALALFLATAAPAYPPAATAHPVRVIRHRHPVRRAQSPKPPLLVNVMASCAVNPARIGCSTDPSRRYRLTGLGDDSRHDGKTASIELATKRNMCGVVGIPVCPRTRRPWVRIALDEGARE